MAYIDAKVIKALRERRGLTQKELGEILYVTDKTVSKWETGRGLPDIRVLPALADALHVSVAELMTGSVVTNANTSGNMRKVSFYVCPVCGNVIQSVGQAVVSCCGIALPPMEAEETDEAHKVRVSIIDADYYVQIDHEMSKSHYISFVAYVTSDTVELRKLYPEQEAICSFRRKGMGKLYYYCNRHGLFELPRIAVTKD